MKIVISNVTPTDGTEVGTIELVSGSAVTLEFVVPDPHGAADVSKTVRLAAGVDAAIAVEK
jgi:hypothetical protein